MIYDRQTYTWWLIATFRWHWTVLKSVHDIGMTVDVVPLDLKFSPSNPRWRTDDVYAIKRFSGIETENRKFTPIRAGLFSHVCHFQTNFREGLRVVSEPHVPPHFCYFNSDEFNPAWPTYRRLRRRVPQTTRCSRGFHGRENTSEFKVADYAARNNGSNVRKRVDVLPWRRTVSIHYVQRTVGGVALGRRFRVVTTLECTRDRYGRVNVR